MKKSNPKKHLRALERRLSHLEGRVASASRDLSYDKAEISALRWAIALAKRTLGVVDDPQEGEVQKQASA